MATKTRLQPVVYTLAYALIAAASLAPVAASGTHKNEAVGYRISVPGDFELKNESADFGGGIVLFNDPYIVDKFVSEKSLSVSTPEGFNISFERRMVTFYFPERSAADIAREREAAKKAETSTSSITVGGIGGSEIYLTFEDYAKDRIRGFFFDGDKAVSVAGLDARIYEMRFEKLTWVPERWLACSYKVPGGEFAVMFNLPESHFDKLKKEANASFKSFKMLDDAGLHAQGFEKDLKIDISDSVDESKMSPEEILDRRKNQRETAYAKCIADLPSGWRSFETDHFLVVYECSPKYAKKVSSQAEAVRSWLEGTFPKVGDGPVQGSIIKVYKDEDAMPSAWMVFSSGDKGRVQEIWFGEPESKGNTNEFDGLNQRVMSIWFSQKNSELWNRMPSWLRIGLNEYIEDGELKGSRLSFGMDEWEKDSMNEARLAQDRYDGPDGMGAPLKPIKLLISRPSDEVFSGTGAQFASAQCSSLVRYLIEGPGSKNSKTGAIIEDYLANLFVIVDEIDRKIDAERKKSGEGRKSTAGMSEEERLKAEDEDYKKRRETAYGSVAKDLLEQVFASTFKDWDDRDWNAIDSSWRKYADGKTR